MKDLGYMPWDPSEYSGWKAYRRSDLGPAEDLAELRWATNVLN